GKQTWECWSSWTPACRSAETPAAQIHPPLVFPALASLDQALVEEPSPPASPAWARASVLLSPVQVLALAPAWVQVPPRFSPPPLPPPFECPAPPQSADT